MQINWLNIGLFLVFSVGHAALIVAFTNRLHAIPLPLAILHRTRQLHDLVIVMLPALFAWFAGMHGPSLFAEGATWRSLPLPLLAYLAVCGAVALSLPAVTVYRLTRKMPMQVSNRSQSIDVAAELGFRPIGSGPYRLLTSFPGNEFLKLEVCDKEFQVPRLPAELDGLSILHLSDLHFTGVIDLPYFERVVEYARAMPADLVVFTGDLLDREDLVDWLPATLGKLSAPLGCCFVLGNHDSYLSNVLEIRGRLESLGWYDVAGQSRVVEHCGQPLVICGSELPWMGTQPDLSVAPDGAFRLLVSHTPDNLPWARQNDVNLMLAGHNHGGQIRLPWFGPVYSPSAYGAHYACGVFWEKPTLLYVSRGISGRHPLRLNCLPELTRLTLRCVAKTHTPNHSVVDVIASG
jgi:predicted MPP superfamily phosphohydrolase